MLFRSLRELIQPGTLVAAQPPRAVTFVENHDISRERPIVRDKMLAYAWILAHEGYPCIYWEDYYSFGLGRPDHPGGIAALSLAHERHAKGPTQVLYVDDSLYVMQRLGVEREGGLVFVLNGGDSEWRGVAVQTAFVDSSLSPVAFGSNVDPATPSSKVTDSGGRADFWAPPRGYVVYARN